jgi:hypothetical protein
MNLAGGIFHINLVAMFDLENTPKFHADPVKRDVMWSFH